MINLIFKPSKSKVLKDAVLRRSEDLIWTTGNYWLMLTTLEPKYISELKAETIESSKIEKMIEKVTPELWKPEMGECYWAAVPYGFSNIIHEYQWEDCDFDHILLERGFIFPTEEQAKAHSEYLIECGLKKRMEDLEK